MNAWIQELGTEKTDRLADRITNADGDRQFAVWLLVVDRKLRDITGFSHTDLPDWSWRDAYDSDDTPADAAAGALTFWENMGDI